MMPSRQLDPAPMRVARFSGCGGVRLQLGAETLAQRRQSKSTSGSRQAMEPVPGTPRSTIVCPRCWPKRPGLRRLPARPRARHTARVSEPQHPYDVLEYESSPIEWLSPERLALASLLHGGPRVKLEGYRYLELGCGNGANLVPLAFYRPHAHFVGLDASPAASGAVRRKAETLGLGNLTTLEADLAEPDGLDGTFDFIVAHGVFSWVAEATRLQLLQLCQRHLAPHGLLYLSYNARPGWDVRGIVRAFLVEHTLDNDGLPDRARLAQRLAATLIPPLREAEHPFSKLLATELELVRDAHSSYVGHDYLAEDNHAFWRREFLALLAAHGFSHVADADFNYDSGRVSDTIIDGVHGLELPTRALHDAIDLLAYRQFHCPLLTRAPWVPADMTAAEFAALHVASCLALQPGRRHFSHPSGYEVDASEEPMRQALLQLAPRWPRGMPLARLFSDPDVVREDLLLLHKSGLLELRCSEPTDSIDATRLRALEHSQGYHTTPWHIRVSA